MTDAQRSRRAVRDIAAGPPRQPRPAYPRHTAISRHRRAPSTSPWLGIVGYRICYITLVAFAWWIGARKESTRLRGHGEATAGKIMGIIGTC